jgi:hypothetical protein
VESNALGSNPFELVALAALRATREHPENFGPIDDWDRHHASIAEKRARLNALYSAIAEHWRDAEIEFPDVRADGYALLTLKFRDVAVAVAPPDTLGERLCALLS